MSELINKKNFGKMFGVSARAIDKLLRFKLIPGPALRTAIGPYWRRDEIAEWGKSHTINAEKIKARMNYSVEVKNDGG